MSALARVPFSALLLAGGLSTRMGADKALLDWQGRPLWQVQVEKLRALGPVRLLVACREAQGLHLQAGLPASVEWEWLFDPPGDELTGPLGAIGRALDLAGMPLLVLAVDMPAMTVAFLAKVLQEWGGSDQGRVFKNGRFFEPMAALYTPGMGPVIRQALESGNYALQGVIHHAAAAGTVEILPMPPEALPLFTNTNTPEEWGHEKGRSA